jgi:hypothetical protein
MDYLVKPVSTEDFLRCKELLRGIQTAENRQSDRTIIGGKPNIPVEIPVGQRTGAIRLAPAIHFVQENFQQQIRNADIGICRDILTDISGIRTSISDSRGMQATSASQRTGGKRSLCRRFQ